MLTINNRKFAKNNSEFTDTLFQKDGTAIGFYKRLKGRVLLYNMQNELFACAIHNRHNEKFIVSASKMDNGKIWYMYALSTKDEKYLGFDTLKWLEQHEIAKDLFCNL